MTSKPKLERLLPWFLWFLVFLMFVCASELWQRLVRAVAE